jgi:hypothetical protein
VTIAVSIYDGVYDALVLALGGGRLQSIYALPQRFFHLTGLTARAAPRSGRPLLLVETVRRLVE